MKEKDHTTENEKETLQLKILLLLIPPTERQAKKMVTIQESQNKSCGGGFLRSKILWRTQK